jgi:hypothetical protein
MKGKKTLGVVADLRGKVPESWSCIDCGILPVF